MGSEECCSKPFRKAIVGGTFDRFHRGHRSLVDAALMLADKLLIGISDGPLLAGKPLREKIMPYDKRASLVASYLKDRTEKYEIVRITDPVGPAGTDEEADLLVVSEETFERAIMVNEERAKHGLRPLYILVIPTVLAENGKPLKSYRIRAGEIDSEGRVLERERR